MSLFGMSQGSMNVDGFREKLRRGQVPTKESFDMQGLFNTYYFQTGAAEVKDLVQPTYSVGRCKNPMTGETEHFLGLGLDSSEDGKNVRERLNVIVVLDISGSMGSAFSGRSKLSSVEPEAAAPAKRKTKMEIAVEVLEKLVGIVREDERLGIVLFDSKVEILQPVRFVRDIDVGSLIGNIRQIRHRGGTNMSLGLGTAMEMMGDLLVEDDASGSALEPDVPTNNRIVFLTDARPTMGGGKRSLMGIIQSGVQKKIYTTFIGVGLDFGDELVNEITKFRGSNYFSVHSASQFNKILIEDFNYFVTPLAFNTVLLLESEGVQIDKVFNSPLAEQATGCLMKVETMSASGVSKEGVKGGMVLIRVKEKLTSKLHPSWKCNLVLQYELPDGRVEKKLSTIDIGAKLPEGDGPFFENLGIRKAVLLGHFATMVQDSIDMINGKAVASQSDGVGAAAAVDPDEKVPAHVKQDLKEFKRYFTAEAKELGDPALLKELDVLDRFIYMK